MAFRHEEFLKYVRALFKLNFVGFSKCLVALPVWDRYALQSKLY